MINDERLEDRVQVILVITGLGATPVSDIPLKETVQETVKPNKIQQHPPYFEDKAEEIRNPESDHLVNTFDSNEMDEFETDFYASFENQNNEINESTSLEPSQESEKLQLYPRFEGTSGAHNLDIPSFLRRRIRTNP